MENSKTKPRRKKRIAKKKAPRNAGLLSELGSHKPLFKFIPRFRSWQAGKPKNLPRLRGYLQHW